MLCQSVYLDTDRAEQSTHTHTIIPGDIVVQEGREMDAWEDKGWNNMVVEGEEGG